MESNVLCHLYFGQQRALESSHTSGLTAQYTTNHVEQTVVIEHQKLT